jgi:hypothetical protein
MISEHAMRDFCRRELESCYWLVEDYENGRRKIGVSSDGHSWRDTTPEESERLRAEIRELTDLLSGAAGGGEAGPK